MIFSYHKLLWEVTSRKSVYSQLLHLCALHMDHMNNEVTLHLLFKKPQVYAVQFWTSKIVLVKSTFGHHIVRQHKHLFLVKFPL